MVGKRACHSVVYVCMYGHLTYSCDHHPPPVKCPLVTWNDTGEQCDTQQIRQLTTAEEAAVALGGPGAICYSLPVPLVT